MIVHFLEVWLLLFVAFAFGCAAGALGYELLAQSPLAPVQTSVSEAFGGVAQRIRERFGTDPTWREYRHLPDPEGSSAEVDRTTAPADAAEAERSEPVFHAARPAAGPQRSPSGPVVEAATGSDTTDGEEETVVPMRPAALSSPRKGVPDDLQRIRGVGRKNEEVLNELGIFHFGQIAALTPAEILWISDHIAFPERMVRDDWIGQAVILASGNDTGIAKSGERRRLRRDEIFRSGNDGAEEGPEFEDEVFDDGDAAEYAMFDDDREDVDSVTFDDDDDIVAADGDFDEADFTEAVDAAVRDETAGSDDQSGDSGTDEETGEGSERR